MPKASIKIKLLNYENTLAILVFNEFVREEEYLKFTFFGFVQYKICIQVF